MFLCGARDEDLPDLRFHLSGGLAQHLRVRGHRAHMHQLQTLALYFLYHYTKYLLLGLHVLGQEYQARAVMTLLRYRDALQQNELVGNLHHNTCAVARLVARLGTAVLHVLQHLQGIVYQLVALASVDIHHHAHAASVVFIFRLVKPCVFPPDA